MEQVFVFGSNEAGRHGAGAALYARQYYGARYGIGRGPTGSAYAIPTKDHNLRTRTLFAIHQDVLEFLAYARRHPDNIFVVTRIGCGLAGYKDHQIAPMFRHAPSNCRLPKEWKEFLA